MVASISRHGGDRKLLLWVFLVLPQQSLDYVHVRGVSQVCILHPPDMRC